MHKYGIGVEQLSPSGQVAVQAAERLGARTVIYRDRLPIAAVVPATDLEKLEPAELTDASEDPLLSLCGTFANDGFVDRASDLERTVLFHRPQDARTGATLKPPPIAPVRRSVPPPAPPPMGAPSSPRAPRSRGRRT